MSTTTPPAGSYKRLKKPKYGHYPFSVRVPGLKNVIYVMTEDDAQAAITATTKTHTKDAAQRVPTQRKP